MALTKLQKNQLISEATDLFNNSKVVVLAHYKGSSVKDLHEIRLSAKESNTFIKVFKNRLVIQSLKNIDKFKDTDTSELKDMLMYAFNTEDELAPAQLLAKLSKTIPSIQFAGAYLSDGTFIDAQSVVELSKLPNKKQLQAMLVGTLAAPLTGFVGVLQGNLTGFMNVLNARSNSIK